MAIIDASVYVAIINDQDIHHAASKQWLATAVNARKPIQAPVIIMSEVAAAVSRGLDDPKLAGRIIEQLAHSSIVQLRPISRALAKRAALIATQQRIRGCDAVYVALAQEAGQPLITLDRQQRARGSAVVTTISP